MKVKPSRKIAGRPAWQILIVLLVVMYIVTAGHPVERVQGAIAGGLSLQAVSGDISGQPSTYATVQTPAGSCSIPTSTSSGTTTFVTPATATLGCRDSGEQIVEPTNLNKKEDNLFNQIWNGGNIYCNKNTASCGIYVNVDINPQTFAGNTFTIYYKVCNADFSSCGTDNQLKSSSTRADVFIATIPSGKAVFMSVDNPKVFSSGAGSVVGKSIFTRWDLVSYNYFDGTGQQRIQAGSCTIPQSFTDPAKGSIIDKSRVQTGIPDSLPTSNTVSYNYVVQWIPFVNVPSSKNPLVDYNGQKALCMAKQIWSLDTFKGADGSCYAFPNKMAGSPVDCCPQDETPTQVCQNYQWVSKTTAQLKCMSDADCQPTWVGDYAKGEIFKGTCASTSDGGKACNYQYKKVSCLPADNSCPSGSYCNLNSQTGDTSCVSASELPNKPNLPATQDNFLLWILIIAIIIVVIVMLGLWKRKK